MMWIAAAGIGIACYLGVAGLLGRMPHIRRAAWPRIGFGARRRWLRPAGLPVSPAQFWLASVALGFLAFLCVAVLTRAPVVAIVPACGIAAMPTAYYARKHASRLRRVQESWPDGLRDLRASISAGRSLPQALVNLSETGPDALRDSLARFPALSRMLGTVAALEVVKEDLADPTSDRVLEVLILGCQRGGAIVQEILDDLIVTTTRDVKVLEEIETDGLEMRINARAVLVMPWLVLVLLTLRGGPFRDFYGSSRGWLVVGVGAALTTAGYALVGRLGRTQVERRIFGPGSTTVVNS